MMKKFFTKQMSNEGVEVGLPLPDGSDSGNWVKILGVDSDHFRQKERESMRNIVKKRKDLASDKDDNPELQKYYEAEKTKLVASLIVDWNLEEELTLDNAIELLSNAPYLEKHIDSEAAKRANFFNKELVNSPAMPNGTTSSKKSQKGQSKA